MAFQTKYEIYFADFDGLEYRASIQVEDYNGLIYELKGGVNPCIINYPIADNKFTPSSGSGCTLNFYGRADLDMQDLFAIGIYTVKVVVEAFKTDAWFIVWSGWLNPELYSEDYTWKEGEMTLSANDGLGAMDKEKYYSGVDAYDDGTVKKAWEKPFELLGTVLTKCLDHVQYIRFYTLFETEGENSDFLNLKVDTSNFVDEDNESMTKRQVLDAILTPLTLRCVVFADAIWIFDPCVLGLDQEQVICRVFNRDWSEVAFGYTYTKSEFFDISNYADRSIYFVGGSQRLNIIGGVKTFTSVYSAYPTTSKIIPTPAAEIPTYEMGAWTEYYDVTVSGGGSEVLSTFWIYRLLPPPPETTFENWGLKLALNTAFLVNHTVTEDSTDIPLDEGDRYVGIYRANDYPTTQITINGGYLAMGTDYVNISFKVLLMQQIKPTTAVSYLAIKYRLKVGSKYYNSDAKTWGDVEYTNFGYTGGSTGWGDETDNFNTPVDMVVQFGNIPIAGKFVFEFVGFVKAYNGAVTEIPISGAYWLLFNEAEILVNGRKVNGDDLQYKVESEVDFIGKKELDIYHSSRRINGILDRGCFLNEFSAQETNFIRTDSPNPQLGSIGKTMGQGYLSNYQASTRELVATIACDQLLRNMKDTIGSGDTIPHDISKTATPVMVVKDSAYLGDTKFMFMGGDFNLQSKELSGTWQEIHDSNYSVTEA